MNFLGFQRLNRLGVGNNKSKLLRLKRKRKIRYQIGGAGKDMTYILGARCSDGVVLVGDTKVTIEEGADYAYGKKITMPLTSIVMGSSGIGGLYMEFQNRIRTAILQIERRKKIEEGYVPEITTPEEFSVLVSKVIREMHEDYGEDRHLILSNLMIISAMRIGSPNAQLTVFTPYGYPEPVNEKRAIGHGEPYGALFLKKMWNKNMTMGQVAKLGIFIIKFIQDMKLDNSVGYDREFLPQVFYIPDIVIPEGFDTKLSECTSQEEYNKAWIELYSKYPIQELPDEDVQHFINEVSPKISDVENLFRQGQFKI